MSIYSVYHHPIIVCISGNILIFGFSYLTSLTAFGPLDRCAFGFSTSQSSALLYNSSHLTSLQPPKPQLPLQSAAAIKLHVPTRLAWRRPRVQRQAAAMSATPRHGVPAKACPSTKRRPRDLPAQRSGSNRYDLAQVGQRRHCYYAMEDESAERVQATV